MIKARINGTCLWLIEQLTFQGWRDRLNRQHFLWVYGSPGTGKTVLVASVIQHLREILSPTTATLAQVPVLHFFCDNKGNDQHKTQVIAILRSLVFQLWQSAADDPLMSDSWNAIINSGHDHACDVSQMFELLLSIIRNFRMTYIIIDALDECENPTVLLNTLRDLSEQTGLRVSVLVSSRPVEKMTQELRTDLAIEVSPEKTERDVRIYTEAAVDIAIRTRHIKILRKELKDEMVSGLISKAKGLYVSSPQANLFADF